MSKCAQIKVGVSAVTLERGFLMKFMIHMDNRQADKVCLITCPSGSEKQKLSKVRLFSGSHDIFQKPFQAEVCAPCHC